MRRGPCASLLLLNAVVSAKIFAFSAEAVGFALVIDRHTNTNTHGPRMHCNFTSRVCINR